MGPRWIVVTLMMGLGCRGSSVRGVTTLALTASPTSTSTSTSTTTSNATSSATPASPTDALTEDAGPFELPFLPHRSVYVVPPPAVVRSPRLIANLHGLCNPPGYACGYWTHAASTVGFLVCPEGNARCGPAAYNAPTWSESTDAMDRDLELAIERTEENYNGVISRQGAVLTGFSKGAYAAAAIAARHPGRWPYLVLVEADVPLTAAMLRRAGVRRVAMLAGEWGTQIKGERTTCDAVRKDGYPIELYVMKKAAHYYSADIDALMGEALAFLLADEK